MKPQVPPVVFYGIVALVLIVGASLLAPSGNPKFRASAMVGQPAPPVAGETLEKKKIDLADYKGKVVLLNFWATWCGPCKQELPTLIALQKKYGPQGFEILGLVSGDELKKATRYAKEHDMTWPQILATAEIGNPYGISGIPANFIIGRDGKVAATIEGLVEPSLLEDELKSHL
jgi:cytochrome c biogenesis protein CcmG, thiol:disulfide interchange protein DsbE